MWPNPWVKRSGCESDTWRFKVPLLTTKDFIATRLSSRKKKKNPHVFDAETWVGVETTESNSGQTITSDDAHITGWMIWWSHSHNTLPWALEGVWCHCVITAFSFLKPLLNVDVFGFIETCFSTKHVVLVKQRMKKKMSKDYGCWTIKTWSITG